MVFRNKDRAITATLAKAFERAEEEGLVPIFKDMSCPISIGYTGFKTFYELLCFPCNKIQDLGKLSQRKLGKKYSCKAQTYWKLNPDITGKL